MSSDDYYGAEDFEDDEDQDNKNKSTTKKVARLNESVERKNKKDGPKNSDHIGREHIVRGTFNPDHYVDDEVDYLEDLDDL
jgi:hypothetical protein